MPVGTYCRRPPCTVDVAETVRLAAERMDAEGVGCAVVVEGSRPVGMITDRDAALEILTKRLDAGAVRAGEIATRPLLTLSEDASLLDAMQLIRRHAVRRVPVTGAGGELIGLLSADDLMQIAAAELGGLAAAIRTQVPARDSEASQARASEARTSKTKER